MFHVSWSGDHGAFLQCSGLWAGLQTLNQSEQTTHTLEAAAETSQVIHRDTELT